jgi:hypothetical protein
MTTSVETATDIQLDEGNHFAAWQEPELYTSQVRAAFGPLR